MAIAFTKPVAGSDYIAGNKKVKLRKLVFSGNYATGGETVNASDVGLKTIEVVSGAGVALSTDLATSTSLGISYTSATAIKIVHFESGAANAAGAEKTNAEAYPTGSNVRLSFTGT